jgi:hypothetical protein
LRGGFEVSKCIYHSSPEDDALKLILVLESPRIRDTAGKSINIRTVDNDPGMSQAFVETETHRTKSRWVAGVFREMGRRKTTIRALYYYALRREASDYPICGGFVGEIRITRPFHESDGDRIYKWAKTSQMLGYLPEDAFLEETADDFVYIPNEPATGRRAELWISRNVFNPLLLPVCQNHRAALVSVGRRSTEDVLAELSRRMDEPTTLLCLSDLSPRDFSFAGELAERISEDESFAGKDVRLMHLAINPMQVASLAIPIVPGKKASKDEQERYKRYLRPYGLDHRRMAELDALEALCPGGIAGFVDRSLAELFASSDKSGWVTLLDLKKGIGLEQEEGAG